jgi:hypothetical protein
MDNDQPNFMVRYRNNPGEKLMLRKIFTCLGLDIPALTALFMLIQRIPYGRNHSNPAVIKELTWDNSQTKALAQRASYDCHSNETVWTWYTNIAPFTWLVQKDEDESRAGLKLSECGVPRSHGRKGGEFSQEGEGSKEIGHVIFEGEIPPLQYILFHQDSRLTQAERQALAQGLVDSTSWQHQINKVLQPAETPGCRTLSTLLSTFLLVYNDCRPTTLPGLRASMFHPCTQQCFQSWSDSQMLPKRPHIVKNNRLILD